MDLGIIYIAVGREGDEAETKETQSPVRLSAFSCLL
jgi:hypothetical protein